jgi:2-(1,2-epoxy-1,2-dihydrophenyl)acetyl-CoA isomerase
MLARAWFAVKHERGKIMNENELILEKESGVAILTLNKPEKFNAMTTDMWKRFPNLIRDVSNDDSIKVLVITGAGRAFCAGSDAGRLASRIAGKKMSEDQKDLTTLLGAEVLCLAKLQKPTIGAINGVAAAAGISIALACDIRIASEQAKFVMAWVKMGLIPDGGATYFLTRLLGHSKALELAFTGNTFDAIEAERIGLVNKVVPHNELMTAAKELATTIAEGPPIAIELMKKGLYSALVQDLESQLVYESYAQGICRQTEDHKEGVQAFIQKRKPEFKGK